MSRIAYPFSALATPVSRVPFRREAVVAVAAFPEHDADAPEHVLAVAALPVHAPAVVAVAAFPLQAPAVVAVAALPEQADAVVAVAAFPVQEPLEPVTLTARVPLRASALPCACELAWVEGVRAFVFRESPSVMYLLETLGVPEVPASAAFWSEVGKLPRSPDSPVTWDSVMEPEMVPAVVAVAALPEHEPAVVAVAAFPLHADAVVAVAALPVQLELVAALPEHALAVVAVAAFPVHEDATPMSTQEPALAVVLRQSVAPVLRRNSVPFGAPLTMAGAPPALGSPS
jgi:hypothetical protein